jgi:hypothetical protein
LPLLQIFGTHVNIELPFVNKAQIHFVCYNALGYVVVDRWLAASETKDIAFPDVPAGTYFYQIAVEGKETFRGKLVKI